MENDPARQQPTTPPNIPPVQEIDTLGHSNKKFIALVVVIVFLLIVAVGEAYYLGTRKNNNVADNQAVPSIKINSPAVTSAPTQLPVTQTPQALVPAPAEGYQEYRNEELGYGFHYLKTDSLYECQDSPCLSIDRIDMRVQGLGTYELDISDIKTSLLQADLYCSADGPTGSARCENKSVDEFINALGFQGYKVTRTRINTFTNGASDQVYDDYVYVYILPEVVKGQGLTDYAAIMFAVDTPLQENLKELTAMADTYFTF
ncbi:hypothetical protein IPM65_00430 [Candidatus Roizmanbacteria bacterium]|nr:MAG: hypothetical protein IPM65_00430 [Candidatus Roizmanbacteria bacterium]